MRTHRRPKLVCLLAFCLAAAQVAHAQDPGAVPLLTLCEALHNLNAYRGKTVVIVARASWTFEGTFLNEDCESDGRIEIQGHHWLSVMALGEGRSPTSPPAAAFPVDDAPLRTKLRQVTNYSQSNRTPHVPDLGNRWVAVYGRIESPRRLRAPHAGSNARSMPGNGYAANGSVPAEILAITERDLGPAPDMVK